jgi:uncharacterized RDD family membrane protein YckC
MSTKNPKLGSPGARLGAFLIDAAATYFVQIAGGIIGLMIAGLMSRKMDPTLPPEALQKAQMTGMMLGAFFWATVFGFTNTVILQGLYGSTVGKKLLGLQVINEDGSIIGIPKAFGRHLCTLISALPLYLGFAALLWTPRRQTFHDSICGTLVIERDSAGAMRALPPAPNEAPKSPSFPNAA